MPKYTKVIAITAFATFIFAGCSKEKESVDIGKEEPTQQQVQQDEQMYITPLSGEIVDHEVTQRPIIVTINNHPDARPQSGLAAADIVYEMVAEGNVTRFLAVYQSELPDTIGPVRSARDYFVELAEGLDAFYVAHGYSPKAKRLLNANVVDNINGMNYDGTLFKRSRDRVAPHNSYITAEHIREGAQLVDASMIYQKKVSQAFYEADESVKIGTVTKTVDVRYGKYESFHNTYTYNDATKTYERASGGVVTVDALTDKPISLANVLFFETPHHTIDQQGRQSVDLTSGGMAYVFQQGYMREVQWENRDGQLLAVESDGSPVKLIAGKTWVHFVSTSPGITKAVTYQPG